MKTVLLFLLVFLAQIGSAETFKPYTPDSLKKGDWVVIESVNYYPYIAPGLKEEVPWRAENIRRITIRGTVTDVKAETITIDYTLENVYDCRNDKEKPGFSYFDSRYMQDLVVEENEAGKLIARFTYDRKSGKTKTFKKEDYLYTYTMAYIPFGVRGTGMPANSTDIGADDIKFDRFSTFLFDNFPAKWEKDGTIRLTPDARIVDASFELPPNTEFTVSNFSFEASKDSTVHKKIFIAYPTDYKVGERMTLLLTPGDSIIQDKELYEKTHNMRYMGRGSEQNNFQYSFVRFANIYESDIRNLDFDSPDQMKKDFQSRNALFQAALENDDFKNMDPYWKKVFERSEQYFEGMLVLMRYMKATDKEAWHKSGLLDWQAPHFASVNPLIDFAYSTKKPFATCYYSFLYGYSLYKKQELKSDNLCLNKEKELTPQENYLLNKQIFSGFPQYVVNEATLGSIMYDSMLSEIEEDYNDFISSCPDTSLTNILTSAYNKFLPFEAGRNIRESGLMIVDNLKLKKGSDRKYILLFLSTQGGLPASGLQNALDFQKRLESDGISSAVRLELYAKFSDHNANRVKPYKAIPDQQIEELKRKGFSTMTILMREDGTILYRKFGNWLFDPQKPLLQVLQKDLNRVDESMSDFKKGFKEGVLGSLLVIVIIGLVYYFRTRSKRKEERNRRHISELELRAIRSQMNPHFIFNALSSIQNLINRSANQEANKYLIDFSRLLRKVLATSEKKLVPLSDELEQLQLYLKLEQLRFPFSYSFAIDENIKPELIEIPGMLIQPFVENAVKHGIAPRGTGEIIIRLSLQKQVLVIDITDDGPGIATDTDGGFGIRAISSQFEILKTLYNTEISITIENRQEKESVSGCHVRLSIPL